MARVGHRCSLADDTPEGRSIVDLCRTAYGVAAAYQGPDTSTPFTAQTRTSGVPSRPLPTLPLIHTCRSRPHAACSSCSRFAANCLGILFYPWRVCQVGSNLLVLNWLKCMFRDVLLV